MSRFQLIFTIILIVLGVGGAIAFAVSKSTSSSSTATQVVMWGTLNNDLMTNFLSKASSDHRDTVNVSYVQKKPATFESDLIAALARGTGPDLILLPQDLIIKQLDKYYPIPYANYSERTFKDSFIPEGELYLTADGVVGLPFSVDPMVMYWNRDIFSNAGVPLPPTTWSDFFTLVPKFTIKDQSGNITQSTIAFGESSNVTHFKDIIALLTLQAGSTLTQYDSLGNLKSVMSDKNPAGSVAAEQAVSYFTEFSNPSKASYSWNRSLLNDKSAFVAGKLAVYFGYASEVTSIRQSNPNLNFDVTSVPQTGGNKVTFGSMNAITILKASKNISAAYIAAVTLTSSELESNWASMSGYPPVRRDLLTTLPGDAYLSTFWKSSLISNGWLDPNREGTIGTFTRLIDNVTSGKLRVSESVRSASQEIDSFIQSNI